MRYLVPLLIGVIGTAILVGLGVWQMQRLAWKEGVLANIDAQIGAPAVGVPREPDPDGDKYLAVRALGRFTGEEAHVLASIKQIGAVYRIIGVFETDGNRRLLVDRGYVLEADKNASRPPVQTGITGNLHWPDEVDSYTPDPDPANNQWFARDVTALSDALGTEPLLIVLRTTSEPDSPVTPLPLDSAGIPNDHLNYALTWFGLAIVWAAMTFSWLWRISRRKP